MIANSHEEKVEIWLYGGSVPMYERMITGLTKILTPDRHFDGGWPKSPV